MSLGIVRHRLPVVPADRARQQHRGLNTGAGAETALKPCPEPCPATFQDQLTVGGAYRIRKRLEVLRPDAVTCAEDRISDGERPSSTEADPVTLGQVGEACASAGTRPGQVIEDIAGMLDRARLRWLRSADVVALRRALLAIADIVSVLPSEDP